MTSNQPLPEFKRNAVRPFECLSSGWEQIEGQYWLIVGVSVVGILIGSMGPMGILMGPMMCGIYLILFRNMRREPIDFGMLFKGFEFFMDSLIATLIHLVPAVILLVPCYLLFFVGAVVIAPDHPGEEPHAGAVLGFFGFFVLLMAVIMILMIIVGVLFTFAYALIVDRRLSGVEAVKLSVKAGLANFWGLLGLLLLNAAMSMAGVLLCYVGAFLVMPIGFAALANAYRNVFGLASAREPFYSPPPPPSFN
jgi:hypothetical protein